MSAATPLEKPVVPVVPVVPVNTLPIDVTKPGSLSQPAPRSNGVVDAVLDTYRSFQDRRAALGLSNPGTVDNIASEVQRSVAPLDLRQLCAWRWSIRCKSESNRAESRAVRAKIFTIRCASQRLL